MKKAPLRVAISPCAEFCGEVFGAPSQRRKTRAGAGKSAGDEQRRRSFGGERDDLDMPVGQIIERFAHGEFCISVKDRRATFSLRQHDGVRSRRHDAIEIGVGKAGLQAVHAHEDIRSRRGWDRLLEKRGGAVPSAGFAFDRDRILKVDDDRVGAARHRLIEFFGAVGGDEEKRAHLL